MIEPCELYTLIPPEESRRIMNQEYCELEFDFMGFEDVYKSVLGFVPKGNTIIDLGCYLAAQCYYFKDYKAYIGIDCFERDYPWNQAKNVERFKCENTTHYIATIQEFIRDILPTLELDLNECFAICSYVPDEEARRMVRETFPYCLVYYP